MALDEVEALERLIEGELPDASSPQGDDYTRTKGRLLNLGGVKALEGVTNFLGVLRSRIGKGFEVRFLETMLGDIRTHVGSVPSGDTLQRWGSVSQRARGEHSRTPSTLPAYLTLNEKLRSSLLAHLNGLGRARHTTFATTAYREAVLREVKSLVRRHLPSSNDDDNDSMMSASTVSGRQLSQQEKSAILARNLRALDPDAAEELLIKTYTGIGEVFRRLGVQVKIVLDITSGLGSPPPSGGVKPSPKSPPIPTMQGYLNGENNSRMQEEMHQALDMSSLLGQAVDNAQSQITKILKARTEQTTNLPLLYFLRYFNLNRLFADECEAVSGRSGSALKNVVNGHIKAFVQQLGEKERQSLAQSMEEDLWNAKDFGDSENALLSRILQGSTHDAESWTKGSKIWEASASGLPTASPRETMQTNGTFTGQKDKTRSAIIDEQRFILPASAMVVLSGIEKFENLICGIPSMTNEIAAIILEYLRLFNSRSCQLILGAGATRSAGLKNITTKHLALASQALSFITAIIPYIREFVRRHAPSSNTLMPEFDKVKRLYQEHQTGIHDKLVDIMSGRASTHVNAMRRINWEEPVDMGVVNAYMETLTKETSTLHRVLSKHLPAISVMMIMEPVFQNYKEQWGKAFSDVELKSKNAKLRSVTLMIWINYKKNFFFLFLL
jgi:vacuolar protein sorting-associated protein 54